MTIRPRELAVRFRLLLLVAGTLCCVLGVWFLLGAPPFKMFGAVGTPISLGTFLEIDPGPTLFLVDTISVVGVMLVMQWLFLSPRGNLAIQLSNHGRPMGCSIVAAAFMAMLLSTAIAATLLEISGWWSSLESYAPVYAAMSVVWLGWAILFYVYLRGRDRKTYLSKMLMWLFGGSVLELLVAAPVHAMICNRAKYGCYCTQGSYAGLVLGGVVLLWTFGPGILLLFAHEKQRREPLITKAVDESN